MVPGSSVAQVQPNISAILSVSPGKMLRAYTCCLSPAWLLMLVVPLVGPSFMHIVLCAGAPGISNISTLAASSGSCTGYTVEVGLPALHAASACSGHFEF